MNLPVDYVAAAASIPDPAFGPLTHAAEKLPTNSDDEPTLHALRWCAGSRFEFIPGDATLYDVLLLRLNEHEILVSLLNLNRTTAVLPFGYDEPAVPGYVAAKLRLDNDCTIAAVCALINRAAAATATLAETMKAAEEMASRLSKHVIGLVIREPDAEDVAAVEEAMNRAFVVNPEGTTSEITPETLKAMFDAEFPPEKGS